MTHRIRCSQIWGGNRGDTLDIETSDIRGSLFSRACDGGKGGDIYYLSVCGSNLLTRIAVADVVGHGVRVSKTSQWLYDSLKANMNSGDGSKILSDLNQCVSEYGLDAMTTAVVAGFYRKNYELHFSYAGHHELLMRRTGQSSWDSLPIPSGDGLSGLPLGVVGETQYLQNSLALQRGDQLFLYTDGVTEAPNEDGNQYGFSRLLETLHASKPTPEHVRHSVTDSLLDFTQHALDHDDVTFMAIEITG